MPLYYAMGRQPDIVTLMTNVSGNPTINGAIVSNFSTGDYVYPTISSFNNNYEICLEITTADDVDSLQNLYGIANTANDNKYAVGIWNGQWFFVNKTNQRYWNQDAVKFGECLPNTHYLVKISRSGGDPVLSTSIDGGINWINQGGRSQTQSFIANAPIGQEYLTSSDAGTCYAFKGTVNLAGCYIDLNGSRVWTGASVEQDNGLRQIKDLGERGVFYFDGEIKTFDQIFFGTELVYQYNSYEPNTVLYESRSSGATVRAKPGVYRVTTVGSGGSNSCYGACNAGGSGAAYEADIYLPAERDIVCKVSGRIFGIEGLVEANGGTNGNWANGGAGKGGVLTFTNSGNFDIIQTIISENGNNSASRVDTVSAYDGTADGYGASKSGSGSVAGIVKIQYLRASK